jgi:hypothetical protein
MPQQARLQRRMGNGQALSDNALAPAISDQLEAEV